MTTVQELDTDEEGYCELQLWNFMKIFGGYNHMSCVFPCENNVKIEIMEK